MSDSKIIKKLAILILCSLLMIGETRAAAFLTDAKIHPGFPGKCYDEVGKAAHAPGSSWSVPRSVDRCAEYKCFKFSDPSKLMVQFSSCGVQAVLAPCVLVRDDTARYPGCCPTVKCPRQSSFARSVEE